jgi:hypothetical protein
MTCTASLHCPVKVYSRNNAPHGAVLCFRDENGSGVDVFMPYDQAKAMSDAFNASSAPALPATATSA